MPIKFTICDESPEDVRAAQEQNVNIIPDDESQIEVTGSYNDDVLSDNESTTSETKEEQSRKEIPYGHMKKLGEQGKLLFGEIPVLDYMIGGKDFYDYFIRKRQPVIFQGVTQDWVATQQWQNESYLLEKYPDVLFDVEMGKVYETSQHPRKTMTMREFLRNYRNTSNMYMDSPFPQSTMTYDMQVPLMMQCDKLYTRFRSSHILFSNGSTSSPLHYDGYENFLTVMSGVKVAYLAHHKYAEDLYINAYHDFPGLSPVNPENVDLMKYPRVSDVPFHKVTLRPGDILYIPEGWFHQVRSYDSPNIGVSMWFHVFEGDYSDVNNSTLRLAELAKHIDESPETIECKNQVVSMFSFPEIILKNIVDEPVKGDMINHSVLYDLVSTSDAMIYVGSDDHWIYAIHMPTGKVKWKIETKEDTGSTCAFSPDGLMVYCGADDSYMRAMHVGNGSLVWAFKTGNRVISSTIVDEFGMLYFGSLDHNMYALFSNGSLKWKKNINGAIWSTAAVDSENDVIYIATENTNAEFNVFALKKQNGDVIWKKFSSYGFNSSPKLNPLTREMYLCDRGGNVYIFETSKGSLKYRFDVNDTGGITSTPDVHDSRILFTASSSGKLIAFEVNTKQVIWQLELGKSKRGTNSSPYMGRNNILYVGGGNGTVFAIQPLTGTIKWQTDIGTGIFFSSPRLAKNGFLYIGSIDGPLYALDSNTGKVVWTVNTNGPLVGTPLITKGFS